MGKEPHNEPVRACLAKAMAESRGWATIEDIVGRLNGEGCWPDGFLASAEDRAKKALVRKLMRQAKDGSGWPTIASVETIEPETGARVRVYKQESLFDAEDYRQVVYYHHERVRHHKRMRDGYRRRCREGLGVQLEIPFGCTSN